MERTHPDDPNRCEGHGGGQQCRYAAAPGDTKCLACGGENKLAKESKRQYLLTAVESRARLAQLSESEDVKSLREEIALARMLVEKRFNLIKTDADLIAACGPLNTMLLTVERLVKTAHTTEQSLGVLLARNTVLALAHAMVEVLIDELEDVPGFEGIVDRVSTRIMSVVLGAKNDTKRLGAIDVEFTKVEDT